MWEFKVTKYDPNKRNALGHYLDENEWTQFSEVGENVSLSEYERVENLYLEAAYEIISKNHIESLNLVNLENYQDLCPYKENDKISLVALKSVVRSILRSEYWAQLESEEGFVHIDNDFYMYIGTKDFNESAIWKIAESGLFVEQMSPSQNRNDS